MYILCKLLFLKMAKTKQVMFLLGLCLLSIGTGAGKGVVVSRYFRTVTNITVEEYLDKMAVRASDVTTTMRCAALCTERGSQCASIVFDELGRMCHLLTKSLVIGNGTSTGANKITGKLRDVDYHFTIVTSNMTYAGTEAGVSFKVFGEYGDFVVDFPDTMDFHRGETTLYYGVYPDLGNLSQIKIWHDGTGFEPLWHIEQVNVTVDRSADITFPAGLWVQSYAFVILNAIN